MAKSGTFLWAHSAPVGAPPASVRTAKERASTDSVQCSRPAETSSPEALSAVPSVWMISRRRLRIEEAPRKTEEKKD